MSDTSEHFLESVAATGGRELLDAVEAEFRRGWEMEKVLVQCEQQRLSEACTRLESAAVDGLGWCEGEIPAASYFYWMQKEPGCWKDKTFRREWFRDNPQFRARYRSARPRTGWTRDTTSTPGVIVTGSKYGGVAA